MGRESEASSGSDTSSASGMISEVEVAHLGDEEEEEAMSRTQPHGLCCLEQAVFAWTAEASDSAAW